MSWSSEENWIKRQIAFWCGDLYPLMLSGDYKSIKKLISQTQFGKHIREYLRHGDDCEQAVSKRYKTSWGSYRFRVNAQALKEIQNPKKRDVVYPIFMVDIVGSDGGGLITYNRPSYYRKFLLFPLEYHLREDKKGFIDHYSWAQKEFRFVFRGSCSSPLFHQRTGCGSIKPSRFEIIKQIEHMRNVDAGLMKPWLYKNLKPDVKDKLYRLVKPPISTAQQLKSKYVICIEGADIASSFGWVLASRSVPIITYPFNHEVWYFSDLRPWVHFIPMDPRGDRFDKIMSWCKANDSLCRQIGEAGREYMLKMHYYLPRIKKGVSELWNLKG